MEYWKFLRNKIGREKIIIPGADGAIIKDNKILLVKNKLLKEWFLPGGLQDLNESIQDTVIREVNEELNLETEIVDLISVYSDPKWTKKYKNGDVLQSLTFLFKLKYNKDSIMNIIIDENEISEYGWFDLNNLPENMNSYSLEMCKDIKNYHGKVILK